MMTGCAGWVPLNCTRSGRGEPYPDTLLHCFDIHGVESGEAVVALTSLLLKVHLASNNANRAAPT
jgi:hypothetical protein